MSTKTAVAAAFDGKADAYLQGREREYGFRVQRRLVLAMIGGRRGRALEIGCGAGGVTDDLTRLGFETVGIDLSFGMLSVARRRFPRGAGFACADVERLCWPDGAFDLVVGMGFLEYLPDPRPALTEIRRVLRPGGEAVLTVPTSVSPSAMADRLFDSLPAGVRRLILRRKTLPSGDPVHRQVPWRLDRILRAHGLEPGARAFCHFTMFPFERIAPRLSESIAAGLEPFGRNRVTGLLAKQYVVRVTVP